MAGDAGARRGRGRAAARSALWEVPFGADDLRHVRALKVRAEEEVRRRGVADREVKRGPGGIRDVEFSAQLLQLVHGRVDPELRAPATLDALEALARGGYVDPSRRRRLADVVPLPAAGGARAPARGRAPDPHRPVGPRRAPARWPASSATTATPTAGRPSSSTATCPCTGSGCAPSTSGCGSGRCSTRSRAPARWADGGRRRPARGLRVHRPRAHPAGRARAHPRAHPLVADDAAAAPAPPRLAVDVARTPTSGSSACADWPRARTAPGRWPARSASRRRWPATSPCSSARAGSSATSSSPTPT